MLLSVSSLSKSFAENIVLKDISFHIEDYEKVALVGINGAGKTTLLRIITGEMNSDSGVIAFAKDKTYGYLAQNQNVESNNTIYEEMLVCVASLIDMEKKLRQMEEAMNHLDGDSLNQHVEEYTTLSHKFELLGGYTYKSEIGGILKGLGFTEAEYDKKIETLSGGQKTRVALGKILLKKPDLIILDEPTNHLDITSIEWLETYLQNYKGSVLIVSHDRFFLDRIASKVIELDRARATTFSGNYSDYAAKKEMLESARLKAYENQQREIAHEKEVIDKLKSFNREKSIKRAESREKLLAKVDVIEKPLSEKTDMKLVLEPEIISGNDVLRVESLAKSFGSEHLFKDLSFEIKRGEKVAIIGANGTGKTTILKLINDMIPADHGTITLGTNTQIGYYDQEHHVLHEDKTLFDEVSDAYPDLTGTRIRNTLAAFLFTGDDVFKRIKDLSGGEKGRMSLAKLMLGKGNFLILDEPTNHLDIASKEILENAISSYTGTVLYVSHDRYFVNKTATRILELENEKLKEYLGNYDYYLQKKEERASISPSVSNDSVKATPNASALDYKAQKEEAARIRKKQNEIAKIEEEIAKTEDAISEIDSQLSDVSLGNDLPKLQSLSKERDALNEKLSQLYENWESLSEA